MARRAHLRGGRRVLAAPVVAVVDPESAGRFFFHFQNFGAGLLAGTGLETAAGAGLGAGVGSATAVFGSARSAVATANSQTGDDRSAGTGGAADARSGITTAGGFDDVGTDSARRHLPNDHESSAQATARWEGSCAAWPSAPPMKAVPIAMAVFARKAEAASAAWQRLVVSAPRYFSVASDRCPDRKVHSGCR